MLWVIRSSWRLGRMGTYFTLGKWHTWYVCKQYPRWRSCLKLGYLIQRLYLVSGWSREWISGSLTVAKVWCSLIAVCLSLSLTILFLIYELWQIHSIFNFILTSLSAVRSAFRGGWTPEALFPRKCWTINHSHGILGQIQALSLSFLGFCESWHHNMSIWKSWFSSSKFTWTTFSMKWNSEMSSWIVRLLHVLAKSGQLGTAIEANLSKNGCSWKGIMCVFWCFWLLQCFFLWPATPPSFLQLSTAFVLKHVLVWMRISRVEVQYEERQLL